MKAIVLCAGYGTRLGNLTSQIPKPMLPIQDRPLLEYIIQNLAKHNFRKIMINLHFMPEVIQNYFKSGAEFGVEITYSHEPTLLGTAGAVRKVMDFWEKDEPFLVHYGDILTNQDLTAMVEFHQSRRPIYGTLLLHQRVHSNSRITLDKGSRIVKFLERPSNEFDLQDESLTWVNSGIYLLESSILDHIPPEQYSDFPRDIFVPLIDKATFLGFPLTGDRFAIDSPSRYAKAQMMVISGFKLFPH